MKRVESLIAELEALVVALPSEPTLEAVSKYVEARAPIATELALTSARTDPSLAPRIERVLVQDRLLLATLATRRDEIGLQLRGVFHARTAARGYRSREGGSRLLRKTA